jgi:molybdopterin converting factor small subunit
MRVKLLFDPFFASMLDVDHIEVEPDEGATVGDTIQMFLNDHPGHRSTLEGRKVFLFDELRAIYSISSVAVQPDHPLADGDELRVLKAFIGG